MNVLMLVRGLQSVDVCASAEEERASAIPTEKSWNFMMTTGKRVTEKYGRKLHSGKTC
jgi:hypothetical protein